MLDATRPFLSPISESGLSALTPLSCTGTVVQAQPKVFPPERRTILTDCGDEHDDEPDEHGDVVSYPGTGDKRHRLREDSSPSCRAGVPAGW